MTQESEEAYAAREYVLTWGDLGLHVMEVEKSAEAIVATGNEPVQLAGGLTR
ncbi:hypothetical protein [Marinoscillum furvescens]|uniref:Uncharacterized protein n=1 Tax=Marinoscillum furvescens DSM 4134 TaxID=1122208 RepID=A0A3D9L5U8_MARFU|nr:hypothetical protein [Marinoscillum furvescens]REE01299.1 hypothetical protein C7460_104321 [Marinoscillum furvescens DSM 4134]